MIPDPHIHLTSRTTHDYERHHTTRGGRDLSHVDEQATTVQAKRIPGGGS